VWIKSSEAFLLVFSSTSRSSFDELDRHYAEIHRVKMETDSPLRMILCGNKCDLEDSREVSFAEAIAKAKQWGIEYYETSAKTRHNVEEVVYNSIRSIRGQRVSRFKLVQGNQTIEFGHFIHLSIINLDVALLVCLAQQFSRKCSLSRLPRDVVVIIARLVLRSHVDAELWKRYYDSANAKLRASAGHKKDKKCIIH
jgi:hypothetical protein